MIGNKKMWSFWVIKHREIQGGGTPAEAWNFSALSHTMPYASLPGCS